MGALDDLGELAPFRIWDGVVARAVDGERVGFAVVELEPSAVVPEHSHDNEQLGMVLSGSVSFRVGDEGAVVIDVFAPVRADWQALDRLAAEPPLWP